MNRHNSSHRPKKHSSRGGGNRRRRNFRPKTGEKKLPKDEYLRNKHLILFEAYLAARAKLFDVSYKADPNQRRKLENNLANSLKQLRDFEAKIHSSEEDKKLFYSQLQEKRLREDLTYSSLNGIEPVGRAEAEQETPQDPHFLISQSESNFSRDTEESIGNIEDYNKYKSL